MHAPGLAKLCVLRAHFSGTDVVFKPFAPQEKLRVVSSLLVMGCHTEGGVYGEIVSQSLCTS